MNISTRGLAPLILLIKTAFNLKQVAKLTLTQVVMLKKVVTKFREKVGNL